MIDYDWKYILSLSQKELSPIEKENLFESLSWLDADDIEINFSDLKSLFRICQDILKFKGEQVETFQAAENLGRHHHGKADKDQESGSSVLNIDQIVSQEEEIKANKEILEQLYQDIAELETRKVKATTELDKESSSSRDPLSEMDAIKQLEDTVKLKNKHIKRLLSDMQALEEENRSLKSRLSHLKDKLSEATSDISHLTSQVEKLSVENDEWKGKVLKLEDVKSDLLLTIGEIDDKYVNKETETSGLVEEMKAKINLWKNAASSKAKEYQQLVTVIDKLKNEKQFQINDTYFQQCIEEHEKQIKKLQEKLTEASEDIQNSAELIEQLKRENSNLKKKTRKIEKVPSKDEPEKASKDDSEKVVIDKLKRKLNKANLNITHCEGSLFSREKELAEVVRKLRIYQTAESELSTIVDKALRQERMLKEKNEKIKTLVSEVNKMLQDIEQYQIENIALRTQLNIPLDESVPIDGVYKKFNEYEKRAMSAEKSLAEIENTYLSLQVESRSKDKKIAKLARMISKSSEDLILSDEGYSERHSIPMDGSGDGPSPISPIRKESKKLSRKETEDLLKEKDLEIQALTNENDGLRKGLHEILASIQSSGSPRGKLDITSKVLEQVLAVLDARHAAGWYAPHMATMMQLQAAIGGRDSLYVALNEARKDTANVMQKLAKESERTSQLELELSEMQKKTQDTRNKSKFISDTVDKFRNGGFGEWVSDKALESVDLTDRNAIQNGIIKYNNQQYINNLLEGLAYFHSKFDELYEKMTDIAVRMANDQNKWAIQEEAYKAEIVNLKATVEKLDNDAANENSVGTLPHANSLFLERKCTYLAESFKYLRTTNENLKNEYLESEREKMVVIHDYELKIQTLIMNVATLSDKLRNCIPMDLFLKQNSKLNDINIKYRNLLDSQLLGARDQKGTLGSVNDMKNSSAIQNVDCNGVANRTIAMLQDQLESMTQRLDNVTKRASELEKINMDMQDNQNKILDKTARSVTAEEHQKVVNELTRCLNENKKQKFDMASNVKLLEVSNLQLQEFQQRKFCNDIEVNMLHHQILDLQSTADSKAIIARLSGEILIAHLQTSDTHKKIERLSVALEREKQKRMELEEMMKNREKIFDVYTARFEFRYGFLSDILQTLREQYAGAIPLFSIEKFVIELKEFNNKSQDLSNRLLQLEALKNESEAKVRSVDELMASTQFDCPLSSQMECRHQIKAVLNKSIQDREIEHFKKKIEALEESRKGLAEQYENVENLLLILTQAYDRKVIYKTELSAHVTDEEIGELVVEDVQGEDRSLMASPTEDVSSNEPSEENDIQTISEQVNNSTKMSNSDTVQAENNLEFDRIEQENNKLRIERDKKDEELKVALGLAGQRAEQIVRLESNLISTETKLSQFTKECNRKDVTIDSLRKYISDLNVEMETLQSKQQENTKSINDEKIANLLRALEKMEVDKDMVIKEYRTSLTREREEYAKSAIDVQAKIDDLQAKCDTFTSEANTQKLSVVQPGNLETFNQIGAKYSSKIVLLEESCFKLQNELDNCKADLISSTSETERWKSLAIERFNKMEQLSAKLKERHGTEVESYKVESEHWLAQLTESQNEVTDLKKKLNEQRGAHLKLIAEKDTAMDHLRSNITSLRAQIVNIQGLLTISDPTFDLSAILEIDEDNDGVSPQVSERLELKFDSTHEIPITSSAEDLLASNKDILLALAPTWQESLVDRLRREKQMLSKQNSILRRQIKVLAGRERRSRLEAQNLKNQIYRVSASNKVPPATAALRAKVESLQEQLSSSRQMDRSSTGSVSMWEKWKKWQNAAEKWQSKFDVKCLECKKLENSLELAKSAVSRLEKEKRILMNRANQISQEEHHMSAFNDKENPCNIEKQVENFEAIPTSGRDDGTMHSIPPHITSASLMDRIEAQQRRIAVLELADKGHEPLVTEYERMLAQNTALKKHNLKLESQVLECQLMGSARKPDVHDSSTQVRSELEHLRSYVEMLKEENLHLATKLGSQNGDGPGYGFQSQSQRVTDLERTVLTLRGLVNKLQAENKRLQSQKSLTIGTGNNFAHSPPERDKQPVGEESLRLEISNLKKTLVEKDILLERSRELMRKAAVRETELLEEMSLKGFQQSS